MPDGTPVQLFSLSNADGLIARITNYGATITELHVPDRTGKLGDVVLGFDNLAQYLENQPYIGSTIGRVANRIAGGRFTLDGEVYALARNNGPNHLHGGVRGFDKVVWEAEALEGPISGVKLSYVSPDGDEGYPGRVVVTVVMTLTDRNELVIDYVATTDRATPINLTNHSYFNFAGQGDIRGHELMLAAESRAPTDDTLIPTGEVRSVAGTAFDFTRIIAIGARFESLTADPKGYDDTFAINRSGPGLALAARVYDPQTGRAMQVSTTEPAVLLYTAGYFDGTLIGKGGVTYSRYAGFCLETQHFPDSVNQPSFPSTILRPDETYRQTTVYRFGAA
jgi:aldose 1-epimerase